MIEAPRSFVARKPDRQPHVSPIRQAKIGRHNTDDAIGLVIELDCFPDQIRLRLKPAAPEAMTQQDNLLLTRLIFFGRECAAVAGCDAKHRKKTGGGVSVLEFFRFSFAIKVESLGNKTKSGHLRKGRSLLPPHLKIAARDAGFGNDRLIALPNLKESIRLIIW